MTRRSHWRSLLLSSSIVGLVPIWNTICSWSLGSKNTSLSSCLCFRSRAIKALLLALGLQHLFWVFLCPTQSWVNSSFVKLFFWNYTTKLTMSSVFWMQAWLVQNSCSYELKMGQHRFLYHLWALLSRELFTRAVPSSGLYSLTYIQITMSSNSDSTSSIW